MDLLDKSILFELSSNCRVSFTFLAQKYGVTSNTIKNRVKILEEQQIIKKYIVELNPKLLNLNTAIIWIKFPSLINTDTFLKLGQNENISAIGIGLDSAFLIINYLSNNELAQMKDLVLKQIDTEEIIVFPVLPPLSIKTLIPKRNLEEINDIEWYILSLLRHNARITLSNLSRKTNLSVKTLRRRIEKLHSDSIALFTIQMNPSVLKKGLMVIFALELKKLTLESQTLIEKEVRKKLGEKFWVSWQVVDRPIILLAFQANNMLEVSNISKTLSTIEKNPISIQKLIGEKFEYFSDLFDHLLDKKINKIKIN
ncbi:Lrp/AsnC family transcriptional regulator [Candidatus Hodarchaeum mangrovi]